jgi:hypothetical protein
VPQHRRGMPALRRRTTEVLSSLLIVCLVASLVGAVLVVLRDPVGSMRVSAIAVLVAVGVTEMFGEGLATVGFLGVLFTILALGLWALHVIVGVPGAAVMWVAGLVAALVLVILARSLIAAASADNPYEDD